MAKLANPSDVAGCRGLGDVTVAVAKGASSDQMLEDLRRAAAEKGATHVVSAEATSGVARGQMYECSYDRSDKPPSRAEQRSGF